MKRKNYAGINESWIKAVGGSEAATALIIKTLKCSRSKAEKLAGRRYPSRIKPLEEEALNNLTKEHMPIVETSGRAFKAS